MKLLTVRNGGRPLKEDDWIYEYLCKTKEPVFIPKFYYTDELKGHLLINNLCLNLVELKPGCVVYYPDFRMYVPEYVSSIGLYYIPCSLSEHVARLAKEGITHNQCTPIIKL